MSLIYPFLKSSPDPARAASTRYQLERLGYFCADTDSAPGKPVYNRTVSLRDTWAKIENASRTSG